MSRRIVLFVITTVSALVLMETASASPPATSTFVDCSKDPGALTAAIATSAAGDTLKVKGACSDRAEISHDLTLVGQGNASIAGLFVESGATVSASNFTISNATPVLFPGVQNFGTLTISGSLITGNATGIFNADSASLTLVKSKVQDNHLTLGDVQSSFGPIFAVGGIYNSGVLNLISSSIRNNSASIGGPFNDAVGGILSINDPIDVEPRGPISVTLTNSDVVANSATTTGTDDVATGGIRIAWPQETVTLTHSTVARNEPDNCEPSFLDLPGCQ
jgi:hypothetical protein